MSQQVCTAEQGQGLEIRAGWSNQAGKVFVQ
jgi:hypothetical protein